MIALVGGLAAGLCAAGLLIVARGVFAPPLALESVVADLHRPRIAQAETAVPQHRWKAQMLGRPSESTARNLAVCEMTSNDWLSFRLTWAALGATPGLFLGGVVASGLWPLLSFWLAIALVPVGSVAGWFHAIVDLRSDAEKARGAFRHATAAYLELVTILMAGGAGPESAMIDAAEIGDSTAFRLIRSALASAEMRREDLWVGLGRVGERLGVADLIELEATMRLAADGAKVKESLTAKADSIREKDLHQSESEAHARSETMVLPVALMFAGFMVLLGFPALAGLAAT